MDFPCAAELDRPKPSTTASPSSRRARSPRDLLAAEDPLIARRHGRRDRGMSRRSRRPPSPPPPSGAEATWTRTLDTLVADGGRPALLLSASGPRDRPL